ncbi:MAG: VWA domain-containing protein [Vicinamibacterales bacterium]
MVLHLSLAAATLAGAALVAPAGDGDGCSSQATFRADTRVVPVYVTVTDAGGRLVPGLVAEDFSVLDNKKPQPISVFDNEARPITVVVMLDTSLSMTGSMDLLRNGAEQFLLRLLPEDRAVVGAFNDKIQFEEFDGVFSSDRDALVASLGELDFGQPTRLYDALDASLEKLKGVEGRRVILVFSDGDDTYSKAGLGDVLRRARDEEVMVYAIGLRSDYFDGRRKVQTRPDPGLRRLAQETGGGYFELEREDDLGSTFTRVAQELHSQYLLGFSPPVLDGKVHEVEVRVKQPGTTARARRSYVADASRVR